MGSGYGGKYKNTFGYNEHLKKETSVYVKESAPPYGTSRTQKIHFIFERGDNSYD